MIAEIEERNQASDLNRLVGKFTNKRRPCLTSKMMDKIQALRFAVEYLQGKIKQRDLMLEDCYTTLAEQKFTIEALKKELKKRGE